MFLVAHPAELEQDTFGSKERGFNPQVGCHVDVQPIAPYEWLSRGSSYGDHLRTLMGRDGCACTGIPRIGTHHWAEIALWLPGLDDHTLNELAHQVPDVGNYYSADYKHNETMLVWRAPNGTEVRVHAAVMHWADAWWENEHGFGVTFLSETSRRHATHHMSDDTLYSLVSLLQVAEISSGGNYRPFRVWGSDFLEAHKDLSDIPKPGIFVPEPVAPHMLSPESKG